MGSVKILPTPATLVTSGIASKVFPTIFVHLSLYPDAINAIYIYKAELFPRTFAKDSTLNGSGLLPASPLSTDLIILVMNIKNTPNNMLYVLDPRKTYDLEGEGIFHGQAWLNFPVYYFPHFHLAENRCSCNS